MMDKYTEEVSDFLENHYTQTLDGVYVSHQPIYGYRTKYAAEAHISRYMITRSILNNLAKYKFTELMDISGAEGYTANLIRTLFGAKVYTTDISENVCKMAKKIFDIESVVADVHNLQFKDNQFEVVLCSETIEHVTDWQKAVDELIRVTDKLLVISVPHDPPEVVEYNRVNKIPYAHINYFEETSLDYLKERGLKLSCEKTLSPRLVTPRIMIEGYKKQSKKIHYKIYNALTPLFRAIFGIKTANWITNYDPIAVKKWGEYGGLTFVIEKNPIEKNPNPKTIKAEDFTGITVPHFYPGKE